MMPAAAHFKLGLFTLVTLIAAAVVMFVLVVRKTDTETYHTYFDESVQGLDPGALVKLRGIRVGHVKSISFAPDHRLIDVELAIDRNRVELRELAPKLRAQTLVLGITGVKLIDLDLATPDTPPPPVLTFPPPERYIPSRPSLLETLATRAEKISVRAEVLIDGGIEALADLRKLLVTANGAASDARVLIRGFDRADLSAKAARLLVTLDAVFARVNALIAKVGRGADSFAELGRSTREASMDLEHTLRDIREAARSLSPFFRALEREPDMLLKGRTRSGR
jgi:ABC-type transporter Mla subunit MlaD